MRLHIGAKNLRGELSAYAKRFNFLEVHASGKSPPTQTTLKKWRKSVSPTFEFAVVLGPNVAAMKLGEALDAELEQGLDAARALQARCIVLPTTAEVTPSAIWQKRIQSVLEKVQSPSVQVAWAPRGPWEIDAAAVCAKKWGIALIVDGARDPVPPGAIAYVRLPALGETRSYSVSALTRLREKLNGARDAYVVFETDSALREAKTLRTLSMGSARSKNAAREEEE
jgi:uncharacterized protein YecE (DUF72 family)